MKHSVYFFLNMALLLFAMKVRSEDQHCMNKATKEISVEIGGDNPQRVMTFVRDDPGYYRNMQCKWILKAANYDNPRQMYINVPVVDFDTNSTEAQCKKSSVDIFNVLMKNESSFGNDSCRNDFLWNDIFRNDSWCSNGAVKVRTEIVNLWDSSYNVTAVFLSDDKQVRNDAKGIQFDVQVLGRDYCHRSMLYLDGMCYLITPGKMNLTEAFKLAKNYLGNVFTGPSKEDMTAFLARFSKKNVDRQKEFPFESPLSLSGVKVWTGLFTDKKIVLNSVQTVSFLDPRNCCKTGKRLLNISHSTDPSACFCGVALEWKSDGSHVLTCEPINLTLPVLIQFDQIPADQADKKPWMFRTCSELPMSDSCLLPPPETNLILVLIAVVIAVIILIVAVILAIFLWRRHKNRSAARQQQVIYKKDGHDVLEPLKT